MIASIASPDASASRQPAGAAAAAPAVGLDDDVPDVAGVGRRAVEQLAVEHDAAADAGRHRQHAVVVVALGRALPALGEGQRLAVEVAVHAGAGRARASRARSGNSRQAGMLTGETVSQWRVIGPAEPTPTHGHAHLVAVGGVELLLDDAGQRLEVGLRTDVLVDEHDGAVEQLAARRDQPGGELGAADVDGQHDRRQPPRRRHRRCRRRRRAVVGSGGDQVRRVRSYPNDLSGRLGFAHGGVRGACWCGRRERPRGFMFPRSATGRSSLVPPPPWHYSGQMLTIEYRTDPAAVAELLPAAARAGRRGSRAPSP